MQIDYTFLHSNFKLKENRVLLQQNMTMFESSKV